MGPSPWWLFLLVIVVLVMDDVALVIWLSRHVDFPGRRGARISASGAALSLLGQGLEYVTRSNDGWRDDLAWLLWFSGLTIVLVGIFGFCRAAWRERELRRRPITDSTEYAIVSTQLLALVAGPLSMVLPGTMLREFGLVTGILLLITSVGVPLVFRIATRPDGSVA